MEAWERWRNKAADSLEAADLLQKHGHLHSGISRGYYAAYQAATAILLYQKLIPPTLEGWEAWTHEATPTLLRTTRIVLWDQDRRNDVSSLLSGLYLLRLRADYRTRTDISEATSVRAIKDAAIVVRRIGAVLPVRR